MSRFRRLERNARAVAVFVIFAVFGLLLVAALNGRGF